MEYEYFYPCHDYLQFINTIPYPLTPKARASLKKNERWEIKQKWNEQCCHLSARLRCIYFETRNEIRRWQDDVSHSLSQLQRLLSRANRTIVWYTFVINDGIGHFQVTVLHIHHTHNCMKPLCKFQSDRGIIWNKNRPITIETKIDTGVQRNVNIDINGN